MITPIFSSRCTGCNTCVEICPTLVLAEGDIVPQIVDIDACQTCYMCEIYCPEDAIYVAPDQHEPEAISEEAILASGLLGRVRHDQGWNRPGLLQGGEDHLDVYWRLGPLLGEGAETAARRYEQRRRAAG
jgi:NAD-dependent dihydropyrimidine dehydrogenase PreA subunit